MAIKINKLSVNKALEGLAFKADNVTYVMHSLGGGISLSGSGIYLWAPGVNQKVKFEAGDLSGLKSGTLPDERRKTLTSEVSHAVWNILETFIGVSGLSFIYFHCFLKGEGSQPPKLTELLKLATPYSEEPPEQTVEPPAPSDLKPPVWPVLSVDEAEKAEATLLCHATRMYEPVFGTGSGSKYRFVAYGDGVKVGVRLLNNSLSVRLEGPQVPLMKKALENASFKMGQKGDLVYASIHLNCSSEDDPVLAARKALGALLMSVDIVPETPAINFNTLMKVSYA